MVKFLINRPVSVLMAFTAFFLLGVITYLNIPVSLLPDIAIPEITVQVSGKNSSARELENTVIAPVRQQLLQVSKLRDIRSETRDGSAIIRLTFEYGADTNLAFIEVNEKIDAAMNYIPRDIARPHVVKASATDIPVFYLNLTLQNDIAFEPADDTKFMELCDFAEAVIKRRIEQLSQVAMVDMTGMMNKQAVIVPNHKLMEMTGITLSDIEQVLTANNVEPGSMIVRDGHYEYNIRFSAVLRTLEDIRDVFIRKNDRIFQLKDLAEVALVPEKEKGMALYSGKRAVVLAVIKQADENMSNMQQAMNGVIEHFRRMYPEIEFNISQNQTELLDYTIANLKENLILAFIFVTLVSVIFLRDAKSPLIIGLSMFVSLIITLMFFYLFRVSLNVVSLTGLILALGMMVDNSIIVTDNIGQHIERGFNIEEACIRGTNEVIAPMLSSSLTTIVMFVPLIFLSGIAGAIFSDQAFSVTVGLIVSYITGIVLLPVMYRLFHGISIKRKKQKTVSTVQKQSGIEKAYHHGVEWVFSHKMPTMLVMLAVLPLCVWLFRIIPKEKMPHISQNEVLVDVDWNENIHVNENMQRTQDFFRAMCDRQVVEHAALVAQQQFMLNREREQTSSEMQVYLRTATPDDIPALKLTVEGYFVEHYPAAVVSFTPTGTIFEKIFTTGEPDLTVEYYSKNRTQTHDAATIRAMERALTEQTGQAPTGIAFQKQLNIHIDREKLLLYRVPYSEVYQALKTGFRENEFAVLRSHIQYLPVVLGGEEQTIREVIDNILVYASRDETGVQNRLPLSVFVTTTPAEDMKTIVAGKNGEYIPFDFYETSHTERIIDAVKTDAANNLRWDVGFSGSYFSNRKMIGELMVILLISILLMYFILAAQFENFVQPLIVLFEIPIDIAAALGLLILTGHSLNLMSAIGIVVTCGIIINDSILKVDMMNQLRREGYSIMDTIHEVGRRRLKSILMTSLTTVVCMAPLLYSSDLGSEMEKPLAIATIGGMVIGTFVSLLVLPLAYWAIYRKKR